MDIGACAAQQNDASVEKEIDTKNETIENQPWKPSVPPPREFDWLQLTSEEWLKGEFKVLYRKKLEFDSDELGLLVFDWKDVKRFWGHRIFSVRLEGPIIVDGLLQVTEDKIFVTVGEERQEFERSQLVSIALGEPKEINLWSAKLSFGLNFSSGNTEQTQYTAIGTAKRRTSATRFVLDYLGNYTRTGGDETVNNHRFNSYFDYFMTRKYFFRPFFGEYYRDSIKNIKHRATVGSGLGFQIIDTGKTEWEVAGGPAYQKTWFDSVEPGKNSSEATPAFVAGTHFSAELTKTVDFDVNYNFNIVNKTSGTYIHHMIAAIETELTSWLDFDISFVWDRTEDPRPEDDSTIPEKDDYYLIFSVGVEN